MSAIRTMCPHCLSPVELDPPEILLLFAPAAAATGSYAYDCRSCERVTVAPLSPAGFAVLTAAGVTVPSGEPAPPPGPPAHRFTTDDLIDFHRLLDTQDWFTQLLRAR
jgi:hypothetical protein